MKFLELVKTRRSVRRYLPKDVEAEKLAYILECARLAPSAGNLQPWFFYIAKSAGAKAAVQKSYPRNWFVARPAPVLIVACVSKSRSWKRSYDRKDHGDIDTAIALEHICLAAAEHGLGTCWICHFDTRIPKEALKLPDDLEPVALTPIGYPDEPNPDKTTRKPIGDICREI